VDRLSPAPSVITLKLPSVSNTTASMPSSPANPPDFLAANADLVGGARPVLARHYSDETLNSVAAHERFTPPDRQPLPL
jgi:hypothetical protein